MVQTTLPTHIKVRLVIANLNKQLPNNNDTLLWKSQASCLTFFIALHTVYRLPISQISQSGWETFANDTVLLPSADNQHLDNRLSL